MRAEAKSLGELLFGQTRGRVLAIIFGHSGGLSFARQIAREAGTSAGTVQRELQTLTKAGLIERSKIGNQVFYKANQTHPVFEEMRSLMAKTAGAMYEVRMALQALAPRIALAFLYGSMARGEEDAGSDIDLMVVGEVSLDEVLEHLAPIEKVVGRSINPTVYSAKEWKSKLEAGNHFLRSVMRSKKVFLVGSEDELGKVG